MSASEFEEVRRIAEVIFNEREAGLDDDRVLTGGCTAARETALSCFVSTVSSRR